MMGRDEGWNQLNKNIRAELDESLLAQFATTVNLPFEADDKRTVAVKILAYRGIEPLNVMELNVRVKRI